MKKNFILVCSLLLCGYAMQAQTEPNAGKWKTWFISSGKDYRLKPPPAVEKESAAVLAAQKHLDENGIQQIIFWNAGAPGYRWQEMISKLWMYDTSNNGVLANMLLNVAIYDATVAAWDTKYAYQKDRPYKADRRVQIFVPKPESPTYPCEYSVAAGVAVEIFSKFYPAMADSVKKTAQLMMASRVAGGLAYPSDTQAGFELGKRIAAQEIAHTKNFLPGQRWDGKIPEGTGLWNGKTPMFVEAGKSKTVVLDSSSQFRPPPPPDFAKDMAELKSFKQTFRSSANAFYYAAQAYAEDPIHRKILEYNVHLNPPAVARIYAIQAIATYDGFVACWDAKYAYWGIRPDQYDTTYKPLVPTPPFPGYPSGHAVMSGLFGELHSYFFPADSAIFKKRAKDGAESRFQAGIHFRTDNEVGLTLGRKIAAAVIGKVSNESDEFNNKAVSRKK